MSKRTKRWTGSTSTPPLDSRGAIVCGTTGAGRAAHRSTPGVPWYFRYHDWFCANHPPIRIVRPA